MSETAIVSAALQSREAWGQLAGHMDRSHFSPQSWLLWREISEWYRQDPDASHMGLEALTGRLTRKLGNESQLDAVMQYVARLPEDVSIPNVVQDALEVQRHARGMNLAALIAERAPVQQLQEATEEYLALLQATQLGTSERELAAASLEEMQDWLDDGNRVKLLPKALNKIARGGALPGHHILVTGRPEVGKTLFLVNLMAGFALQGKRVLYIGNEDPIKAIQHRTIVRLSNMTYDEYDKQPKEAWHRAKARGLDLITFVGLTPGSIAEAEELAQETQADVVMLDQIRNMPAGEEGLTRNMEASAIRFRNMLKRHQLVGVSVAQARAGDGDNPKVWGGVGDVDSSRTGLVGTADLMIYIGADEDMLSKNQRALSIVRNKLGGGLARFLVEYDLTRNKIRGAAI